MCTKKLVTCNGFFKVPGQDEAEINGTGFGAADLIPGFGRYDGQPGAGSARSRPKLNAISVIQQCQRAAEGDDKYRHALLTEKSKMSTQLPPETFVHGPPTRTPLTQRIKGTQTHPLEDQEETVALAFEPDIAGVMFTYKGSLYEAIGRVDYVRLPDGDSGENIVAQDVMIALKIAKKEEVRAKLQDERNLKQVKAIRHGVVVKKTMWSYMKQVSSDTTNFEFFPDFSKSGPPDYGLESAYFSGCDAVGDEQLSIKSTGEYDPVEFRVLSGYIYSPFEDPSKKAREMAAARASKKKASDAGPPAQKKLK